MQRARALQWPESVLEGNSYSGTMLKHIKTFCIIYFFVAPFGDNILPRKVCPKSDFLAKILALFEKAAGRGESIVAGHTPNSRGINSYIKRVSHNNIGHGGALPRFLEQNSTKFWTPLFCIFSSEIFLL